MQQLDMTYEDTWNTRELRLSELGITYSEFLSSEHWLDTIKKSYSRSCYNNCDFCSKPRIDLHHSSYKWLMTKDELRVVYPTCRIHHKLVHDLCKEFGISVRLGTRVLRNPFNQYTMKQIQRISPRFKSEFVDFLRPYPNCTALERLLME